MAIIFSGAWMFLISYFFLRWAWTTLFVVVVANIYIYFLIKQLMSFIQFDDILHKKWL